MKILKNFFSTSVICGYVLIGVEFIFMISPFVAYYYTIYGRVLKKLFVFPLTSWLTGFFLPHIVLINTPFFVILNFAGPFLIIMGLFIFFVCAAELYIAKIKRANMIMTKGLYSLFLHPQYLGLAVCGLGFLLIWPRFLTLIMYITMLFMYYLLAKDEENKMENKFGDAYKKYKLKIPNFSLGLKFTCPFSNSGFKKIILLLLLYVTALTVSVGIGFALREYTKSQLPTVYFNNMVAVALRPEDKNIAKAILEKSLADERVVSCLLGDRLGGMPVYLVYIMPLYAGSKIKHVSNAYVFKDNSVNKNLSPNEGFIFRIRNLHDIFILGPLSRLNTYRIPEMRRAIFCRVVDSKNKYISVRDVFNITNTRTPVIFVEMDIKKWEIVSLIKTPLWRKFIIPMPAF